MSTITLDFSGGQTGGRGAMLTALPTATGPLQAAPRSMPPRTELGVFRGQRVLAIIDADNLDFSLQRYNVHLAYGALLRRLEAVAEAVFPVAVLTMDMSDARRGQRLREGGWRTVDIPREAVRTSKGLRIAGNADADLTFELGAMSYVADCSMVLVGTGDGDLAISCARGLRRARKARPVSVHTLSVLGSTSARLRQRSDLFAAPILIGMDLVTADAPNKEW